MTVFLRQFVSMNHLSFNTLAKIGGFAAIFARSGSHHTKAVALTMTIVKGRKSSYFKARNPPLSPPLKLWTKLFHAYRSKSDKRRSGMEPIIFDIFRLSLNV